MARNGSGWKGERCILHEKVGSELKQGHRETSVRKEYRMGKSLWVEVGGFPLHPRCRVSLRCSSQAEAAKGVAPLLSVTISKQSHDTAFTSGVLLTSPSLLISSGGIRMHFQGIGCVA